VSILKQVSINASNIQTIKTGEEIQKAEIPDGWESIMGQNWMLSLDPDLFADMDDEQKNEFMETMTTFFESTITGE